MAMEIGDVEVIGGQAVSVRIVQRALAVIHLDGNLDVSHPGPDDGKWGDRTQAALSSFLELPESEQYRPGFAIEVVPHAGADDEIHLPWQTVEHFEHLASLYQSDGGGGGGGDLVPQEPVVLGPPRRQIPWWVWLGVFVAGALAIGTGYWLWRRSRRR